MYSLKTESSFDSAHFLHSYKGKCHNIHGHCWVVTAVIHKNILVDSGNERGMVIDFKSFKSDLKKETEKLDHALLIEKDSLMANTLLALNQEGFKIISFAFRPTAENLSKYFWDKLKEKGYPLSYIEVRETSKNCAVYSEAPLTRPSESHFDDDYI
jgi:6-pyruvoyltetrahydropterin/6-carboxytetrahydropterin synthase